MHRQKFSGARDVPLGPMRVEFIKHITEVLLASGVLVGVLDTGCDADHIQLREKQIDFRYVPHHSEFAPMRDVRGFDVDGHGTHVCGIIAGKHVGVAPEVDLLVASVLESETNRTSLSRIARGLDWMLAEISSGENFGKPAIINMSFGFITEKLNREDRNTLMFDVREAYFIFN